MTQPPQKPDMSKRIGMAAFCGIPLIGVIFLVLISSVFSALQPAASNETSSHPNSPPSSAPPAPHATPRSPIVKTKPANPYELTERRRHDIWNDYNREEDKLEAKLDKISGPIELYDNENKEHYFARMQKRSDHEDGIRDAYQKRLFKHWHITDNDLQKIRLEGFNKIWAGLHGPRSSDFPE